MLGILSENGQSKLFGQNIKIGKHNDFKPRLSHSELACHT